MDHKIQVALNMMLKSEHFWLVINVATSHFGILKILSPYTLLTLIRKRLLIWSFVQEQDIYILLEKIWKSEFGKFQELGLKLRHLNQMILSCKTKRNSTSITILRKTMNKSTFKKMRRSKWLTCCPNMPVLYTMKKLEHLFLLKH